MSFNASFRERPSAKASPPAATHTDRLSPLAQQTSVGTFARRRAATVSAARRMIHDGLSPPSDNGNRQRISSRGKVASASLSANSITASTPVGEQCSGFLGIPRVSHPKIPGLNPSHGEILRSRETGGYGFHSPRTTVGQPIIADYFPSDVNCSGCRGFNSTPMPPYSRQISLQAGNRGFRACQEAFCTQRIVEEVQEPQKKTDSRCRHKQPEEQQEYCGVFCRER